ncbi:MAG TPA: hypothetical protein VKT30_01445 [Caulobacteraceae bacterium]|nr:hypothetical protein [Caulobacteraceae bacterium]
MTLVSPQIKTLAGAALYALAATTGGFAATLTAVNTILTREPSAVVRAAEDVWFNVEASAVVYVQDLENRLLP